MGAEIINGPAHLVEEVQFPIGVGWADKRYNVALLRAEQFGDQEQAFDALAAKDPNLLGDDGQVFFPVFQLQTCKRLMRITEIRTEDGSDKLEGEILQSALKQGLWPEDGRALAEADVRLGKRLPHVSGGSEAESSAKPDSESSATGKGKSKP